VKNKKFAINLKPVAVIGLGIGLIWLGSWLSHQRQTGNTAAVSVYERVMQRGVLRCGTFEEAPFTMLDVNTGKRSGYSVELAERVAREWHVKLEWVPVSNFGAMGEDLRNGRYDAICASAFTLPRAGTVDYTTPYAYVPVYAYTKAARIANFPDVRKLDWAQLRVVGLDGEGATTIARQRLPQAQWTTLPETSSIPEMLTALASDKGDVSLVMPTVFANYDRQHPGELKQIQGPAFHVFPVSFMVKPNEPAMKNALEIIFRNMQASGELAELADRFDPQRLLYRPAQLY
jgi:polar amino acid transport system substrate-binding protein